MPTILVVDDEPAIQHAFSRAFRGNDFTVLSAHSAVEAVGIFSRRRPDVVVLDINLPDSSGLQTFHRLHSIDARIPVILITGHGTTELAIGAMKEGAFDYLLKPLELSTFRALVDRAIHSSHLMKAPAEIADVAVGAAEGDLLVGRSPGMQELYKSIGRVARQDETVLILGESGTGKELVARAIYQHSDRADQAFVAINCGAIPESLIESELFGHEKGAFTGADRQRIGRFEQASGGTIFLDEVGELPPMAQVKMLRVLQERKFERVGGAETVSTNVRLIAATNADLSTLVAEGKFRKDLFFRLNVFTIRLPALRDRGDDLQLLIEHFIQRFSRELGKNVQEVTKDAIDALLAYQWPGNIRELQSCLKHGILTMRGAVLTLDDLPASLRNSPEPMAEIAAPAKFAVDGSWSDTVRSRIAAGSTNLYAEALDRMERELLVQVLKHTSGNKLQAARILGITRGSLRTKIRALGITMEFDVWSDDDQADS